MSTRRSRTFRLLIAFVSTFALLATAAQANHPPDIVLGAVYPTGGQHGRGGIDEARGVSLAMEYVNARGGVRGRKVRLLEAPANNGEQAPAAVRTLIAAGVPLILGSYSSLVSRPAADVAQAAGVAFWETGAVGILSMAAQEGDLVFRFAPTGQTLGRSAVEFAQATALPDLGEDPTALRYGVVYVDDDYGRAVGTGAIDELKRAGLTIAGIYPYDLQATNYASLVSQMKRDRIEVLFVSSYLAEGVAIRRETVKQRLGLIASVGTSSSYCMHEFGEALGRDAVGLFASDKPDGHILDPSRLAPEAGAALRWAKAIFQTRFKHKMTAPALTGFAGAYALVTGVLPNAGSLTTAEIAAAARLARIPQGALPNGSGMAFGKAGIAGASDNLRATSVIWQWVAPGTRAVVYPPAFASQDSVPLRIS